mmetsp:Transcript_15210/g.31880  ORF Transcript_15210/g.31880 Transcript_15210/m.31880 type:complete len:222 (+) Transcript_15210:100-765(+)
MKRRDPRSTPSTTGSRGRTHRRDHYQSVLVHNILREPSLHVTQLLEQLPRLLSEDVLPGGKVTEKVDDASAMLGGEASSGLGKAPLVLASLRPRAEASEVLLGLGLGVHKRGRRGQALQKLSPIPARLQLVLCPLGHSGGGAAGGGGRAACSTRATARKNAGWGGCDGLQNLRTGCDGLCGGCDAVAVAMRMPRGQGVDTGREPDALARAPLLEVAELPTQ